MSRRSYAYLDLAALPAIGSALLADNPVLLFAADGRRVLFANAAGCAFMGEREMARLLDRHLSAVLPSTEAIARFARSVPLGGGRLERIRFPNGGRLASLSAQCTHLALPGGEGAVLLRLDGPASGATVAERARVLVDYLAAEDCLVAILGPEGGTLARTDEVSTLAAGETAIEQLAGEIARSPERLLKRVVRVDGGRRPAAIARFESAGLEGSLLVLGPVERIEIEPPSAAMVVAPTEAEASSMLPPPETALRLPYPDAEIEIEPSVEAGTRVPSLDAAAPVDAQISVAAPALEPEAVIDADLVDDRPAEPEIVPVAATDSEPEPTTQVVEAPAEGYSEPEAVLPAPDAPFRFVRPDGPIRFVFQMDAETRFTLVSPELAAAVGPQSADVVGARWADVATARRLDPAGSVAAILARRDTWSGVTLTWPVDGGAETVAVDLAALPAFSRERKFEGYRGFGVIRPADPGRQPAPVAAPAGEPASNVVRLPRATSAAPLEERLSPPEQEAFRRIAAALGGDGQPASPPATAPQAEAPPPVAPSEPTSLDEPPSAPPAEGDPRLDAAERKIAELEAILDTATDGILIVDEEGRIERINRSAEALFGIESASVAGHPFTELLAEESRKLALDYLDGLARNGVASVLNDGREVIGRVPQGGLIPLFMTMGRLQVAGRFCAVLRDITQWKNAEEELIGAKRAAENASTQKSDFLAKISHEIRTPLNAIIGFSEVMMEERFGPIGSERYKEYLRDIHVSGAHLMSLINDLLDLSKIEAGKLDLAFQAVALNDIVMECVAVMQPQANRERIIIRTALSGLVPNVVADARSIRQIVLNLLSNAVKFTLAGGQVIVSTAMEEHGEVTLRIRDTGVGMSEKDIETALKPFRQLATSRERRSDGTGLGLPLTKALVEANRASFAIDSTVGQGTLVRVTFPPTRVLAE